MLLHVRPGNDGDLPFMKKLALERCKINIPPTRKASPAEVEKAVEHFFSLWPQITKSLPSLKTYILEDKETLTLIGYIILLLNQVEPTTGEKQAFIQDGGVLLQYEGKGWWRHLMRKAEEVARESNHHYLVGMITATNKASLAFSQRLGFTVERHQVVKIL